jgi:predicted tellurium resistance membrane protein TerC
MQELFSWENIGSLLTLTVMEIVLGVDNIVFISIVSGKLPTEQQSKARIGGLSLAMLVRIGLLFTITWVMTLKQPLFSVDNHSFTVHDLILMAGGLFLMAKSISEINHRMRGIRDDAQVRKLSLRGAIMQIVLLDIVFSFDSILTAIGIAKHVGIMILAVVISMGVMMLF